MYKVLKERKEKREKEIERKQLMTTETTMKNNQLKILALKKIDKIKGLNHFDK